MLTFSFKKKNVLTLLVLVLALALTFSTVGAHGGDVPEPPPEPETPAAPEAVCPADHRAVVSQSPVLTEAGLVEITEVIQYNCRWKPVIEWKEVCFWKYNHQTHKFEWKCVDIPIIVDWEWVCDEKEVVVGYYWTDPFWSDPVYSCVEQRTAFVKLDDQYGRNWCVDQAQDRVIPIEMSKPSEDPNAEFALYLAIPELGLRIPVAATYDYDGNRYTGLFNAMAISVPGTYAATFQLESARMGNASGAFNLTVVDTNQPCP